jgi:hypothetical protein
VALLGILRFKSFSRRSQTHSTALLALADTLTVLPRLGPFLGFGEACLWKNELLYCYTEL